jgi:hypothetical protein
MPAWGSDRDDDLDMWRLVHFIRHLRELTPEQLKEMESLNPMVMPQPSIAPSPSPPARP